MGDLSGSPLVCLAPEGYALAPAPDPRHDRPGTETLMFHLLQPWGHDKYTRVAKYFSISQVVSLACL